MSTRCGSSAPDTLNCARLNLFEQFENPPKVYRNLSVVQKTHKNCDGKSANISRQRNLQTGVIPHSSFNWGRVSNLKTHPDPTSYLYDKEQFSSSRVLSVQL
jgi:hypothetical protein